MPPDQVPAPAPSGNPTWPQVAMTALQVVQMVLIGFLFRGQAQNHTENQQSFGQVVTQIDNKAKTITDNQEKTAKTAVEVKQALESPAPDKVRSQKLNLYTTWKTLEWIANESTLKKDADAAAEAKKLYDDFVKKNP